MKFARTRKGIRYSLFDLAEKFHGKIRPNETDGIFYVNESTDLNFQLVFELIRDAEEFQSAVRKISRPYGNTLGSSIQPPLEINLLPILSIPYPPELRRVYADDYALTDPTGSPEFSMYSQSLTTAVELSEETRFRLIDNPESKQLFRQKPEKCHILSQKGFKQHKSNPNNIIFMSRYLHQQFDAIDSTEGISTFFFRYHSHVSTPTYGPLNGKNHPYYETNVEVVFKDDEALRTLGSFFKPYSAFTGTSVLLILYFPNPDEFKGFSKIREDMTIAAWASFDGSL